VKLEVRVTRNEKITTYIGKLVYECVLWDWQMRLVTGSGGPYMSVVCLILEILLLSLLFHFHFSFADGSR